VRNRWVRGVLVAALAGTVAVAAAGCGGGGGSKSSTTSGGSSTTSGSAGSSSVKGTITFDGIWTSSSGQKQFQDVINAFQKQYPNVTVKYKPVGNSLPTVLATAVAGGHPPDMADIAQPGTVQQFVNQGKLKPITYAQSAISSNFAPAWAKLGTFSGKLYALPFKAANKSLVWYNVPAFTQAGVTPPKTWTQLLKDAQTIKQSGTPAYSIGGADGWTLTDLFENIYLRTFGPAKYAQLAAHKIKWTDPSVTTALNTMAQVIGDTSNIAGGASGALQNGFNTSVTNAFSTPAKGAMVFEADFVGGVILSSTKAKPKTGFNVFPFPTIKPGPGASAVEIAGDMFVTFRDTPAIEAFVKYLATAPAAEIWAKQGGFGTGNKNVAPSVYPDPITKTSEAPILSAKSVVFDMSDEQPPSFGGTAGQGEWGLFQQFLRNPKDVSGIQQKLEAAASSAYKKGK
jgi:alpha-glucoside transport system substrate-binding protein